MLGRDQLVGPQQEDRQQGALLDPAKRQQALALGNLQWAEDPKFHAISRRSRRPYTRLASPRADLPAYTAQHHGRQPPGGKVGSEDRTRRPRPRGAPMTRHRLTRSATLGLALAALAAPAAGAQQQDLRSPDTRDPREAARAPQDLRSPDTRDAAAGRSPHDSPQVVIVRAQPQPAPADGLDWADAGI